MDRSRVLFGAAALAVLAAALGLGGLLAPLRDSTASTGSAMGAAARSNPAWLARLNLIRERAGLPPVPASKALRRAARRHAMYVARNDILAHTEEPQSPWYSEAGSRAGAQGNVMASSTAETTNRRAIDTWATGPFHAVAMLDPELQRVGFGADRDGSGAWEMAATLTLNRGAAPADVDYPIRYPAPGATTDLLTYEGLEYPDPLSACPGYEAPTGAPIVIQIGPGVTVPNVGAHSLTGGDGALAHCVFDERTYENPDAWTQNLGRAALNTRDAIVIVPREPLQAGERYSVSITVGVETYEWWFRTAPQE